MFTDDHSRLGDLTELVEHAKSTGIASTVSRITDAIVVREIHNLEEDFRYLAIKNMNLFVLLDRMGYLPTGLEDFRDINEEDFLLYGKEIGGFRG